MRTLLYCGLCLWILSGCQSPPTKVELRDGSLAARAFSQVHFGGQALQDNSDDPQWVLLDTRPLFDYQLLKTPRSFHFAPEDWRLFAYKGAEQTKRRIDLQRRLAIKGVDPDTMVVVYGSGTTGNGAEFYAAALLGVLGVKKVMVVDSKQWSSALVAKEVEPLRNKPYWDRPMQGSWSCRGPGLKTLPLPSPQKHFRSDLTIKLSTLTRGMDKKQKYRIQSRGDSYFEAGLMVGLLKAGYDVCFEFKT